MKLSTFVLAIAVSTTPVIIASSVNADIEAVENRDLIACGWFPSCGDPDIYSPVLQPKDAKTTTDPKDVKDEAIA